MLRHYSKTAHCDGEEVWSSVSPSKEDTSSTDHQKKLPAKMSPHDTTNGGSISKLGSVDSGEVFLRNPRTGGYDFTPAQLAQSPRRSRGLHYVSSDEEETLRDSTVYTSYTRKPLLGHPLESSSQAVHSNAERQSTSTKNAKNPLQTLLSPRSRNTFQRYFHTKANKTPNPTFATPSEEGVNPVAPVTPSPKSNAVAAVFEKLMCRVISSPRQDSPPPSVPGPERIDFNSPRRASGSSSATSDMARHAQLIMNSPSLRRPKTSSESQMQTPPRSGRSPNKESPISAKASVLDPPQLLSPSSASCLDFSFASTLNKTNESLSCWTFDPALSPLCGGKTQQIHDEAIEFSFCNTTLFPSTDNSGFDADNDDSTLDLLSPDALSLASAGALLLTEEGLKRHNDKKLLQETVEQLTLRQPHGVGKLEKEVLKQKVERLQAKEFKKQAETSLEEERAARKRRLAKARQQQQQRQQSYESPSRTTIQEQALSPISNSPQVSIGTSPSPTKPSTTKPTSFLSKVLPWKKKPTAEELKRQWKERERQRVELAQQEKEQAERLERERIEELRQSYLHKQRQLEAVAASKTIVDVDDLIETMNYPSNVSEWGSSNMSPSLGPCTVCQKQERTHIAMPCMHFAFCGPCVQNQTMCPVCTTQNVCFSRVNTE